MAVALVVENANTRSCSFPTEEFKSPPSTSAYEKTYYKFYQLKLRQLVTENRHREEQEAKTGKSKQLKHLSRKKRSYKDYMHHVREKVHSQSQDCSTARDDDDDDHGQSSSSVISLTNQRTKDAVTFTITSNPALNTPATATATEPKPRSNVKPKRPYVSIRRQRIISAPSNSQKPVPKKPVDRIPTIEIDLTEDDALSVSNGLSYTEATSSSSSLLDADENQQCARQSMLHTLMLHWNCHPPSDMSKWEAYQHFGDKFSASISSSVYRSFERIML